MVSKRLIAISIDHRAVFGRKYRRRGQFGKSLQDLRSTTHVVPASLRDQMTRFTVAIIAPATISKPPAVRLLALTNFSLAVKRCVLLPSQAYKL